MSSLLDVLAGTETQAVVGSNPRPEVNASCQSVGIEVIPYNACLDPQADSFLPWLWKRMQEDDLVDYYFPGQKDTGFATFVRMFSGDAQVAMFKSPDTSLGNTWEDRIPGFITWSPLAMGSSNMIIAGFIFFKRWWGEVTDDAARAAFNGWFTAQPPIDCVLGVCPALHKLAMRYDQRIGLHEIGRIPDGHLFKGRKCDAVLFAMTREDWRARCQQQQSR